MGISKTADAVEILQRRYIAEDATRAASLEEERVNAQVARTIRELRQDAGLTQKQLAELIRTTQSVISRLEDADYEGHSLSMLDRIARALNRRVRVLARPGTGKETYRGSIGTQIQAKGNITWKRITGTANRRLRCTKCDSIAMEVRSEPVERQAKYGHRLQTIARCLSCRTIKVIGYGVPQPNL